MIGGLSDLGTIGVHQKAWTLYGVLLRWKLGRISILSNINKEAVILNLRQWRHFEDNPPPLLTKV